MRRRRFIFLLTADEIVIFSDVCFGGEGTHVLLYGDNRLYKELVDEQKQFDTA